MEILTRKGVWGTETEGGRKARRRLVVCVDCGLCVIRSEGKSREASSSSRLVVGCCSGEREADWLRSIGDDLSLEASRRRRW